MEQKKKKRHRRGKSFIPYDYEQAYNRSIDELHEYFVEQMIKHRKKAVYALKEIRSGEQLEIEMYPQFRSMDAVPPEGRMLKKDNSAAQKNLNDKNARKYVERLINENFTDQDIWITLTYNDENLPENMDEALKNMQNYIRRVNYQRKKKNLQNCRYVYITEFDPDAEIRWHHHLVMDGNLDMDTVERCWKKGDRNEVRRLNKDDHGLSGMAHYITKESAKPKQGGRSKGQKRWCSSQNLRQFRVRVVHSKRSDKNGRYTAVDKYINPMVKNQNMIQDQLQKWYPEYSFTEAQVYYNEFNCMFYINARMRKIKNRGGTDDTVFME